MKNKIKLQIWTKLWNSLEDDPNLMEVTPEAPVEETPVEAPEKPVEETPEQSSEKKDLPQNM